MIELKSNYWDVAEKYDVLVCTTNSVLKSNGELVMGAGIAKDFKDRYPDLPRFFGGQMCKNTSKLINGWPFYGIMSVFDIIDKQTLIALQTKYHYKDKSPLDLIVRSCEMLKEYCDKYYINKVLMTRPGCGNGGLKWEDVKPAINFLDDRFVICYDK